MEQSNKEALKMLLAQYVEAHEKIANAQAQKKAILETMKGNMNGCYEVVEHDGMLFKIGYEDPMEDSSFSITYICEKRDIIS